MNRLQPEVDSSLDRKTLRHAGDDDLPPRGHATSRNLSHRGGYTIREVRGVLGRRVDLASVKADSVAITGTSHPLQRPPRP